MKGKNLLVLGFSVLLCAFGLADAFAQAETPIVVDNVMQVRPRRPPQPSKYFSGTNIKKDKKMKIKTKMVYGWECPSYLNYNNKPKAKREKMLKKRRNKNTYAKLN